MAVAVLAVRSEPAVSLLCLTTIDTLQDTGHQVCSTEREDRQSNLRKEEDASPVDFTALGRDRWCHRATHGSPWAKRDQRTHLVSTQRLVDVVSVGCLHLKLGDFTPSRAGCQALPQCTAPAECHSPTHLPGTVPHVLCLVQALSSVTSPAHRHVGSQTLG